MEILLIIIIGLLYSSGIYMMLRRSLVKLIIVKGKPPIIGESVEILKDIYADPIPQALILTAIVISFGLQSFAIILIKRTYKVVETDDLDELNPSGEEI